MPDNESPAEGAGSTSNTWSRRTWLAINSASLWAASVPFNTTQFWKHRFGPAKLREQREGAPVAERVESDRETMRAMAQRAVEAARAAGAQYADVHLTHTMQHWYVFGTPGAFDTNIDDQGIGVRALVNGYWGFAACPTWDPDDVTQMARDAVAQAKTNARGPSRTVDLGTYPAATGEWSTAVTIDPFTVSLEEKADYIHYWENWGARYGAPIDTFQSNLQFIRQERVTANTEGLLVAQTLYESGGVIATTDFKSGTSVYVDNIDMSAQGWERFLNANIPEQLTTLRAKLQAKIALKMSAKPAIIGEYTIVCDGITMGHLLDSTLGAATQLDRALGYEANASGTSFLSDPLTMAGQYQVTGPSVTITGNRSESGQLATVQWDEEGVTPTPFTLVKDGVLVDYQTTREQAAWLAPYYQKQGKPIRSNGCAASQNALTFPMQHTPNLTLEAGAGTGTLDDLIANVERGIYLGNGNTQVDFQARGGMLYGEFRDIRQGRLGPVLNGGAILFNTEKLWKNVMAVGGERSAAVVPISQYANPYQLSAHQTKGQPPQMSSHSVRAVGATIAKQNLINPSKRA